MLQVLGLDPASPEWSHQGGQNAADTGAALDGLMAFVLEQRATARQQKDWPTADAIRDRLSLLGITVEDSPTGARWALTR